jgi:predicted NBD/HSP70 family sugar kinase
MKMLAVTAERVDGVALWRHRLTASSRRVADTLRAYGPSTRAELVALTGLSRPTVSAALVDLVDADLVTERTGPAERPAGGRPAAVVRLTRSAGLAVGVDIGRRHVRVAVADLGHRVLDERAMRLDADSNADDHPTGALLEATRLVDASLAAVGAERAAVVGVGMGIPAPITTEGRVGSPELLPAWAGLAAGEELALRLNLPVRAENDANLGALGEYMWGAGRGCDHFVFVKMATGIGAGIVLDGKLYRGAAGTAGELGHVTLDTRGEVCRCGNRGCVELGAGGRSLLASARQSHPEITDLSQLVAYAIEGQPVCRRLLNDAGTQLGFAIGGLINVLNPQRLALGGELAAAGDLLREPVMRGVADAAMAAAVQAVEVVPGELGRRAAALGGVALALGVQAAPA